MKTFILALMLTLTAVTGVVAAAQPVFAGQGGQELQPGGSGSRR